ncbi:MAG: vancomycin high temperature exclusion protein [Bacteroidetes bacterium]|nr:MAG: vancomycin high temperature exclusion protein [Bacteroidota bacterium]
MRKKKSFLARLFSPGVFLGVIILFLAVILICNLIIIFSSRNYLYDNVVHVPETRTAVVLGTSRFLKGGAPNPYFHYRISAAAELYNSGKVQYIILSGDNRTRYYNEPEQMRRELQKYNVPDCIIYLDYAGLRTLDSMVRSKEIFGQDSIIVVSQKFHNQRAVFLARINGIHAIGYNAKGPDARQGIRTNTREVFARVKVFIDIISGKQPRHLGDEVIVGQ